jgi:very-short-patch-repair endonuclease
MYLVRSVTIENLSAADKLRRSLISHFAAPFSQDEAAVENLRTLCESPFETEVYDLLVDRGYRVTPQVKVGHYRIDMVVEGNNDARLAIECDGDKYHGADKWSDDMRRQRDLERAGWSFWRCFASTFLRRRTDIVSDLMKTLAEHGIEPVGIEDGPRSIHTEQRIVSASQIDIDDQPATFDEPDNASDNVEEALRNISADLFKAEPLPTAKDKRSGEINVLPPKPPAGVPKPIITPDLADVLSYCRENNLRTLDNRQKNGAFWVFHSEGQGSVANRLSLMGMRYAERKGWWLK